MVATVVIFDIAHAELRKRLTTALHKHGFILLFRNVMLHRSGRRTRHLRLARDLARIIGRAPHKLLILRFSRHWLEHADWLIGPIWTEAEHEHIDYRSIPRRTE